MTCAQVNSRSYTPPSCDISNIANGTGYGHVLFGSTAILICLTELIHASTDAPPWLEPEIQTILQVSGDLQPVCERCRLIVPPVDTKYSARGSSNLSTRGFVDAFLRMIPASEGRIRCRYRIQDLHLVDSGSSGK